MASQVITPENLKKTIDAFVEKKGVKAFLLSNEVIGNASAPSKNKEYYSIPVAVAGDFFVRSNLGKAMKGIYLIPIDDLSMLSPVAKEAYDANCNEHAESKGGEKDAGTN